jgi:agmatine deiminase
MRRWPAEWEKHAATWISWPHHEPDWPGKFEPIPWVYAEIVRVLSAHERVEILCHDQGVKAKAKKHLEAHGVRDNVNINIVPSDRVWLRDSFPMLVDNGGKPEWLSWRFNAWAKYDNFVLDAKMGAVAQKLSGIPKAEPMRPAGDVRVVLEGGSIDSDGRGTLLTTEECLLSDIQCRNPGLTRSQYEAVFEEWLGIKKTIWLGEGCVGDDTHGHVDDIARFVAPGVVVLAFEDDPADENHKRSVDNLRRLDRAGGLRVVKLPYPRAVIMDGQRLPASYANFYIANGVVMVPTFNDKNDRVAMNILAELMPDRRIVGIHCLDLVWGLGTLHCLTQQQPATG